MTDDITGTGGDNAPDQDRFDHDDELRALLRDVDPASSLSPADPSRVARLLEEAMSPVIEQATEHRTSEQDVEAPTRQTGTHHRNPLTWLVAAAAVLIIGGVGAFGLMNRGDDPVPTAGDGSSTSPGTDPGSDVVAGPAVGQLTAGPADTGRCIAPTPEFIRSQAVAFEATVTSMSGEVVTLAPSTVFAGKVAPEVEVTAPSADLQALIGAVKFEVGKSYLVSATDGQVTVCGFSGPATPQLQQLYDAAFTG